MTSTQFLNMNLHRNGQKIIYNFLGRRVGEKARLTSPSGERRTDSKSTTRRKFPKLCNRFCRRYNRPTEQ